MLSLYRFFIAEYRGDAEEKNCCLSGMGYKIWYYENNEIDLANNE